MPVSWEVASGPTTAYKMAGHGSTCVAVEGPKNSNILNFRVQDSMSFCFCMNGEPSKGPPNCRLTSAHETVMRGLSALSLHGAHYQQVDVNATCEDSRSGLHGALFYGSPEMERCTSSSNNENLPLAFAPAAVCGGHFNGTRSSCNADLVQHGGMRNEAISNNGCGNGCVLHFDALHRTDREPSFCGKTEDGAPRMDGQLVQYSHSIVSDSSTEGMLRTDGFDLETISETSNLSNNYMLSASSSSGEVSQLCDESEVQSSYKEGNVSRSEEPPNLARIGLSRFYAGKSRSFSCLTDTVSAKDLAKHESPFLKKRKINASGSRLPPLQKGSATISKKPTQNGKSTLALAVAMSAKQENEPQPPYATLKSLVPSRSYSLSDLQGAGRRGSLFLLG